MAGHSAGAYHARGLALHRPDLVAGLALVCPLLGDETDVPDHRPVVADDTLGDAEFRDCFVPQTPVMWERYQRFVQPAMRLVDQEAAERIGARWELSLPGDAAFGGPVLVAAGRRDAVVGHAGATRFVERSPNATLAVVDGAGHALPHERPVVLEALLQDWVDRVRAARPG